VQDVLLLILGAVLAYMFGRWQAEHERLYEQRARVIADLFSRFEDVDQRFYSLFNWIDLAGEPDKQEKARLAAQSFNELQGYYRQNSLWLPRRTSNQFSSFLARYRKPFNDFTNVAMRRDGEQGSVEKWVEVWSAFEKESPEVRQTLETEFRAALGSWRARLVIFLDYLSTLRRNRDTGSGLS
jgi:hypothetical protein